MKRKIHYKKNILQNKLKSCPSCHEKIGHLDLTHIYIENGYYQLDNHNLKNKLCYYTQKNKTETNIYKCPCCNYIIANDLLKAVQFLKSSRE